LETNEVLGVKSIFCNLGEQKWRARGFVLAALLLSLIRIWMLVKVSYNQRNFETALAEKDKGQPLATHQISAGLLVEIQCKCILGITASFH
jgi:hypothetical protein